MDTSGVLTRVGDYALLSILGEGGMGVVYLGRTEAGEQVAIKMVRPHLADNDARERLSREASALSRIRHPRVAEVIDADPWGPEPFVVIRYIEGPSLLHDVADNGPYRGANLRDLAAGIAEAIAAAHEVGVLHRDVKPSNVLIGADGPVLIDFGLALTTEDPRLTVEGFVIGTPGYLAPEVLFGEPATPATDVHSWAATIAYAATGRSPAGKGPAMAVMDRVRRGEFDLGGLPEGIAPLIRQGLDPEPEQRPSLGSVLEQLGGSLPVDAVGEPRFNHDETRVLSEETRLMAPPVAIVHEPHPPSLIRQRLALAFAGVGIAGLVAILPYLGAMTMAVLVALLRFISVTGEAHRLRWQRRGHRKWYDIAMSGLASPSYLARSLAGTAGLLAIATVVLGAAAIVVVMTGTVMKNGLLVLSALLVLTLWWGPGSRRVREIAHGWTAGWSQPGPTWLRVMIVGVIVYVVCLLSLDYHGPWWTPASVAPWEDGWLAKVATFIRR